MKITLMIIINNLKILLLLHSILTEMIKVKSRNVTTVSVWRVREQRKWDHRDTAFYTIITTAI